MWSPLVGTTVTRNASCPAGYGICHTSVAVLKMTIHSVVSGMTQSVYLPAGSGSPTISTSRLNSIWVARSDGHSQP
jgi:hypothetical protein